MPGRSPIKDCHVEPVETSKYSIIMRISVIRQAQNNSHLVKLLTEHNSFREI